jgi:hypothetical protein
MESATGKKMRRGSRDGARIWHFCRVLGRKAPRFALIIETIPHSRERYPTVEDWQIDNGLVSSGCGQWQSAGTHLRRR